MSNYYSKDYKSIPDNDLIEKDSVSGSGGGGCFPAGTFVRTTHGHKPIEKCEKGDFVIGYDKSGKLDASYVTELVIHEAGTYQDSLYFVYSKEESLFPEGITGNHAIYDIVTNEHKEVSTFKIGDKVTLSTGITKPITRINRISNPDIPVYNLIVEPSHTYLVGSPDKWVKVHNGGGGKGGQARAAVEAPNTLQSSAIAKVLEVISYGEIEGVVGGAKGVYFDNTVLENPDGSSNFPNATFDQRTGLPSQTHIPGFTDTEAEVLISPTTITSLGVTQQLVSPNIDAARITIRLPDGLWKQVKTNGDLIGYTVSYAIYTKDRNSSTWGLALSKTINDKTTSAWEIAHRIPAPAGSTLWDVKVVRTSPEDTGVDTKSVIQFARLTEITEETLTYNNIAYTGITIPASTTGNRIPARGFQTRGLKIQVPTNYDPILRTYGTNYWDGSFKTAWTDNPAWVLYDLLTHPEYGMANFLNQPVDVDIWAFYEASLYNDCATYTAGSGYTYNLLPDGEGGFEVRYTFNAVIQTQQDAWQLLQAVASNMRAILVMKGGQISLLQDRPKLPKRIINNTNVIDGLFVYSGTESTSRATAINCTFNDKKDRYLPVTISEQDNSAIAKYGYSVKDIVAYGAVKESQARRMAKWALYTETHQYDQVSFSMSINIMDLEIGDVISIMDADYISDNNTYLSGRVISASGTSVTLDRVVTLDAGYTYTFGVMSVNYDKIEESIITNPAGTTDTLTLSTALPAGNYTNHEFFCYSSGYIEPRDFLIQSITESSKGLYAISGIFYDKNKFNYVEQGLVVVPPKYTNLLATVLPPVSNITFSEVFLNTGIVSANHISVNWLWDESHNVPDQVTFSLRWRRDNRPYTTINDIAVKSYDIPSIVPGVYEVIIEAQNIQGKKSVPTSATYQYRTIAGQSTLLPPENFYVKNTTGTSFVGNHIPLTWTFPVANETKTDTLLDYVLKVVSSDGLTILSTHVIKPNESKGGSFDYTFEQNVNDFSLPSRSVLFRLYSRDMVGDLSVAVSATFTNPVPTAPNFTVLSGLGSVYVDITPTGESDVIGYIIYRSTTNGYTPSPANIVYDGPDTYITLKGDPGVTYYYRVAAYDSFGRTGLNIATQQSSTAADGSVPVWVFDGLIFKPNDPSPNLVSWTAGSASLNGGAPIPINAGNSTTAWTSGIQYFYYDGSSNTISVTTSLAVAVTGTMVLATYKGGTNLVVGNGDAYVDGNLILANTVGASQLVSNNAVITNTAQIANAVIGSTHIQDGAITNAKIGNSIESTNFNGSNGWGIYKGGSAFFNNILIRDPNGRVILQSGSGVNWDAVTGAGKPQPYADVTSQNTALNIAGQGAFATLNQINSSNVSTYIANLAVDTLQIAGNAVTFPESATINGQLNFPSAVAIDVCSLVVSNTSNVSMTFLITFGLSFTCRHVSLLPYTYLLCKLNSSLHGDVYPWGTWGFSNGGASGAASATIKIVLSPGQTTTLILYAKAYNFDSGHCTNRFITSMGVKR